MGAFFKTGIVFFLGCMVASTAQFLFASIALYPYNTLNIVVVCIMTFLFVRERGSVVWFAFALFFLLDAYGAGTPFGILLFSGTVAALCCYWSLERIVTNRSWYAAGALTIFFLAVFRLLFTFAVLIIFSFTKETLVISRLFPTFGYEILLTVPAVMLCVFVLHKVLPSLRYESRKTLFVLSRGKQI